MRADHTHRVLWKSLDRDGHDACRFAPDANGWRVEGAAAFAHAGEVACLSYRLLCDKVWETLAASVSGWIGGRTLDISIERSGRDHWIADGRLRAEFAGLKDVDLGFTPASNTNAIRRLDLSVGEEADCVALWLDTADWALKPLAQRYRRVGEDAYDYVSPQHGYRARLLVDRFGAIRDYPDLWVAVPPGDAP